MKQYIDETEVERLTGMKVQTLRNWRFQRRGFPYVKISRSIRYDLDDVIAFMQSRKINPESEA